LSFQEAVCHPRPGRDRHPRYPCSNSGIAKGAHPLYLPRHVSILQTAWYAPKSSVGGSDGWRGAGGDRVGAVKLMRTILVLAEHPEFAASVRAAVNPERYRVVHRTGVDEAEELLQPHLVGLCVADADLTGVQALWLVERIRRRLPDCPLVIYTSTPRPEWEEEVYLQGVRHVLSKPVRARLLNALLDRSGSEGVEPSDRVDASSSEVSWESAPSESSTPEPFDAFETLSALRDFSAILGDSLCAEALMRQFLLRLREVIGVNRSAVFLRLPPSGPGSSSAPEPRRVLKSVCAVGLAAGVLEQVELTLDSGIGHYLHRHGRVLRRDSREALRDPAIRREFNLLSGQVAIPIFDREALVGVAVLDGRVTGELLSGSELRLIFHLLEAMGLAVKNIWLHDQLAANHEMLSDVLRQFNSGCVVVGQNLAVLHINKAARACFSRSGRSPQTFEFSDLPQPLGSKIYHVLSSGTGVAPFRYEPPEAPRSVYQVSIVPIFARNAALPGSALMIVEDLSQSEQLRRLEIEASNLRLVRQMADRLAHEIGNAMVPLSTHQQLFAKKFNDAEFRASLDNAMTEGVRRVSRLINQMRLLAREDLPAGDVFPLSPLVEESFQEAQKYQPVKSAQLKLNLGDHPILLLGDRASIKHAMVEILLNALQANPTSARLSVSVLSESGDNGDHWVLVEFRDSGSGFTPEAAARVPEPFFTTRNVGLGLGLVVSRKVAESHRGRLEILSAASETAGVVRLSLPVAPPKPLTRNGGG
jgi:signal transduction histidine kinase/DNA-binding NarL/FixJ family response regulator